MERNPNDFCLTIRLAIRLLELWIRTFQGTIIIGQIGQGVGGTTIGGKESRTALHDAQRHRRRTQMRRCRQSQGRRHISLGGGIKERSHNFASSCSSCFRHDDDDDEAVVVILTNEIGQNERIINVVSIVVWKRMLSCGGR